MAIGKGECASGDDRPHRFEFVLRRTQGRIVIATRPIFAVHDERSLCPSLVAAAGRRFDVVLAMVMIDGRPSVIVRGMRMVTGSGCDRTDGLAQHQPARRQKHGGGTEAALAEKNCHGLYASFYRVPHAQGKGWPATLTRLRHFQKWIPKVALVAARGQFGAQDAGVVERRLL